MARRQKIWRMREDYRPLLRRIKKLFPTVLGHIKTKRIMLVGFENPSSSFIAQIRKNGYPWAMALPDYDYVITFWSTRFDNKPKSYRLFVMLHELLHIPEGGFDRKNKKTYRKLRRHDIEDFSELRHAYGIRLQKVKDIYKGEKALYDPKKKSKHHPQEHIR
jgi:predicted metallopeptidase